MMIKYVRKCFVRTQYGIEECKESVFDALTRNCNEELQFIQGTCLTWFYDDNGRIVGYSRLVRKEILK